MPLLLLLFIAFVGCGDALAPIAATDASIDAGALPDAATGDAAPMDPGFDGLQAEPDADLDEAREDDLGLFAGARGTQTCYDEADNDGDDQIDCDVSTCQMLGSCCIGHGDCCEEPATSFVATCAGSTLVDCTVGTSPFGTPGPFLDGDNIALGGDDQYDSGLLAETATVLSTRRQVVQVTFDHPTCDGGCLESAAVGFTLQDEMSATAHVTPILALQMAQNFVQVRIGDSIVHRFEVSEARSSWTMTLRPTGVATIAGTGVSVDVPFEVDGEARLVAWGHSRNPSATLEPGESRSGIASLTLSEQLCENPHAWEDRNAVTFFVDDVEVDVGDARRVDTARLGSETWVFVTHEDDRESLGIETARGVDLLHGLEDDPLKPRIDETIVDTALVTEDGAVRLYVVLEGTESRRLVAANWNAETLRWDLGADEPISLASDFRAPTMLVVRDHLVLVGEREDGLSLLVRKPDDVWIDVTSDLRAVAPGARHPSLILHGHAYELHYARRVGARWHIGLAASDELISWRAVDDRVLSAGSGFDRLGARAPAAVSEDQTIRLYYVGQDGVQQRLGRTTRAAPTTGRFGS